MLRFRPYFAMLALAACTAAEKTDGDQSAAVTAQSTLASVTLQEFQQLRWIEGVWRGSGGNYPSFFEEYRVLDDSTIRMRAFSDSTRATVTDSSTIEWRNGSVRSRSERSSYDAIEVTPVSIRFRRPGESQGGHTFQQVSPNEWTATLHPLQPQGQATVYVMRRIGP